MIRYFLLLLLLVCPRLAPAAPILTIDSVSAAETSVLQGQTDLAIDMTVTAGADEAVNITTAGLSFGLFTWEQQTPSQTPGNLQEPAMVYDAQRKKTFLFGGFNGSTQVAYTFEWDGTSWTEKTPTTSPPERRSHAMAYDSARQRVVLFGGSNSSSTTNSDTWEWDGTSWEQKSPATSPPGRRLHRMAFDSARQRVVLFGGLTATGPLQDTWEWDGTSWTEKSPASVPEARYGHALAYSLSRQRLVLFGGGGNSANLNDTWEWDGTNWAQKNPATSPAARIQSSMEHDSARSVEVLFGGNGDVSSFFDTWEWDGTNWTEKVYPSNPPSRFRHGMAYDSDRKRLVVYGGTIGGSDVLVDTWELGLHDRTSNYSVTPSDSNPTSIAAGATSTFAFTVDVAGNASIGEITIDGTISGTGAVSSASTTDTSATTPDSWTVVDAFPAFEITQIAPNASSLFQGQSTSVTMAVTNTGNRAGTITTAQLDFSDGSDVSFDYTVTADPANPTTIATGSSVLLTFTVAVSDSAATGSITIDGFVEGTDGFDPTADTDAQTPGSLTVLGRARLSITEITATAASVVQGTSGLTITMSVTLSGAEAVELTTASLVFVHSGSSTDVTSQYTIRPDSGNPTTIATGATAVLTFSVDVSGGATTGTISIDGTLAGVGSNTGTTTTDRGAGTPDSWLVTPTVPSFRIDSVSAVPASVFQGQSGFSVTMTVTNTGTGSGTITTATPTFANGGDVSSEYVATPAPANATSIATGATAVLTFSVAVDPDATTGTVTIDGSIAAAGVSGSTSDTGAETTDSWLVKRRATLSIQSISAVTSSVLQGQQDVPVTMSLTNTGEEAATLDTAALEFAQSVGLEWRQESPASKPSSRTLHAMAYDASRERVVLFGGAAGSLSDETWEWDGTNWTLKSPTSKPSARAFTAMAYQASRERVVLFGGSTGSNSDETWEWDGTNWTLRNPASKPTGRHAHRMAYDALRDRVVLFGGFFTSSAADETWEWDGTNWAKKSPSSKPSARSDLAMAYDSSRGRVVLFGGFDGAIDDETWEWDGTNWTQKSPSSKPPAHWRHDVAFDASRERLVLFGGITGSGTTDETWEWDGTNWALRSLAGKPSARSTHAMAYDASRKQVVLFGGDSGGDQTWTLGAPTSDVTAQYTFTPDGGNPASVGAGATVTLTFSVDVSEDAATGSVIIDGTATGTGAITGVSHTDTGAAVTDSWTVQLTLPVFRIDSISAADASVVQGQGELSVTMTVTNTGTASGTITTAGLTFANGGDVTSQYSVTPDAGNATSLAAGASAVLTFTVDVSSTATLGAVTIDGSVAGSSSKGTTGDSAADTTDSWTVLAKGNLAIDAVAAAPATVVQAQSGIQVSMTVSNSGAEAVDITTAELAFSKSGSPVSTQYAVTASAVNATSLAAGAASTFTFSVAVDPEASTGAVVIDGHVSGTGQISSLVTSDSSAGITDTWTVLAPAALAIQTVRLPSPISQGQSFTVTVTVTNSGQATARLTSASLSALDATSTPIDEHFTLESTAGFPVSIAGGSTVTLSFDITTSETAPAGNFSVDASVMGTDTVSGNGIADASAASPGSSVIQTQATLTLGTVSTAPQRVSRGQTGLLIAMSATNAGQAPTALTTASLRFVGAGGSNRTTDFMVMPSPANPTSISSQSTVLLTYTAAVSPSATTGVVTITGQAAGQDSNSGRPLTATTAATPDSFLVQRPAAFAIQATALPPVLSQGQTFTVTLTVLNTGEASAQLTTASLSARDAANASLNAHFGVGSRTGIPQTVPGGAIATVRFVTSVSPSAPATGFTVDATVGGFDLNTNALISDTGATTRGSSLIQRRATLSLGTVSTTPATVSRGQSGIAIAMTATNSGQASAVLTGSSLRFIGAGESDRTAEYTVTPSSANPSSVPGESTVTLGFTAAVSAAATTGTVTITGQASGRDFNSSASLAATTASTPDSFVVQAPAVLAIQTIALPSPISQGQTFTVNLTVKNTGAAGAQLSGASLAFRNAANASIGSSFTVNSIAGATQSLAGGATGTIAFSVTASSSAPSGVFTVDGTVSGTDSNSGAAIADTGANTPGSSTLQTRAQLAITQTSGPSLTAQGRSIVVQVTLANSGQATTTLTSVAPIFKGPANADLSAQYSASTTVSFPSALAGGQTRTIPFTVAISASATTTSVVIQARASGRDANSSAGLVDPDGATSPASMLVVPGNLPFVSSISPATLLNDISNRITFTGINFAGTSALRLDDPAATAFTSIAVLSDTAVAATLSAGVPAGTYGLVVTRGSGSVTAGGTKPVLSAGAPIVASFSPLLATNDVSTPITLTGSGFTGATAVKLDDAGGTSLASLAVRGDGVVTATIQAGIAPGHYRLAVTTPRGVSAASDQQLTVVLPGTAAVAAITPALVNFGDPAQLTATGSGFTAATSVTLDDPSTSPLTALQVLADGTLTATLPSDVPTGPYHLLVTTPGGTSAPAGATVRVVPAGIPYVAAVEPAALLNDAPNAITLTGINFSGATALRLTDEAGTPLASLTVRDDGTALATLPAGVLAGSYRLIVTRGSGQVTAGGVDVVVSPGLSIVTGAVPARLTNHAAATLALTGSGFTSATALTLDDAARTPLTSITVQSDGALSATLAAGAPAGAYRLLVTTPRGTSAATGPTILTIDQAKASLEILSVAAAPSSVSRGQVVTDVRVSVLNSGLARATGVAPALTFGGVTAGYAAVQTGGSSSIEPGTTAAFAFTVTVGETAALGDTVIDATATATDSGTGGVITTAGADRTDSWLVRTAARVSVVSVTAPASARRGDTGLPITITLRNDGQAELLVTSVTPTFGAPGITAQDAGTNPSSIPGGQSAAFAFLASVTEGAAPGPVAVGGSARGRDADSGAESSDDSAETTAVIAIERPAELAILSGSANPSGVRAGQAFTVGLVLSNPGDAAVRATTVELDFTVASGAFSVAATAPIDVAARSTSGYSVAVTALASGTYAIGATARGQDAVTGARVESSRFSVASTFAVTTVPAVPASLRVGSVSAPARAAPGDTFEVLLLVSNPGGTPVSLQSAQLTFTVLLTAAASPGNPTSIAAGQSAILRFQVTVPAGTPAGQVRIGGQVTGRDAVTNASLQASLPDASRATLEVSAAPAPPGLRILSIVHPGRASQAALFQVTMTLENSGSEALELRSAALRFAAADRSDLSTAFKSTSSLQNPAAVAAGARATLRFNVQAAATAPLGLAQIDGSVTARGVVTRAAASATGSVAALEPIEIVAGQPAARLLILAIETPAGLQPGDDIPVTLTVLNSGLNPTAQTTAALIIRDAAGNDITSLFDFFPDPSNPTIVGGGATVQLRFVMRPKPAAPAGTIRLDGAVTGVDFVSGSPTSSSGSLEASAPAIRPNQPPTANAGPDLTRRITDPVRLDGSLSRDPDATAASPVQLTFRWRFLSVPAFSAIGAASLSENDSPAAARPSFVPDRKGEYLLALVVSDGKLTSGESRARVTVVNTPPAVSTAAGPFETTTGSAVTLQAAGSDADREDSLAYTWGVVSVPAQSRLTTASAFSGNGAASERFTPDAAGTYRLSVSVSDGTAQSPPALTSVVALNVSGPGPVLEFVGLSENQLITDDLSPRAGLQTNIAVRRTGGGDEPIQLLVNGLGIGVSNPGATGRAEFPEVTLPFGTASTLELIAGTMRATLRVRTVQAPPPVARVRFAGSAAGGPRVIALDAFGSFSAAGDALTYRWTLVSAPAGASAFSATGFSIAHRASLAGTYRFRVTAADGSNRESSAEADVSVSDVAPVADAGDAQSFQLTRTDRVLPFPTRLTATFDGSASADPNGSPLTYFWEIVEAPDSTLVRFDSQSVPRPTLRFSGETAGDDTGPLRAAGRYLLRLTVSDGALEDGDTVELVALDPSILLPRADAGLDRVVQVSRDGSGNLLATIPDPTAIPPDNRRPFVRLDGRESNDSQGRPIAYSWSLISKPAASPGVTLSGASTAFPTFVPGAAGSYVFELVVNNGLFDSSPSRVSILVEDSSDPPTAIAVVEDLAGLRAGSVERPVLDFAAGERVVLNGSLSTDSNPAQRASLTYRWTQTDGGAVALEPGDTSPTVSFVPSSPGRLAFQLTATDSDGAADRTGVEVIVRGAQPLPDLSIVATASTTSATGTGFGEGFAVTANPRSLRATVPTTVTLRGRLTGAAGGRFDYVWRQLAGPVVILSSDGATNTAEVESTTRFSPTTSRVHMFEWAVYPLDSAGRRTGVMMRRFVRTVIDTAASTVPEPGGSVTPSVIPLVGSSSQRSITLDGRGFAIAGAFGPNVRLSYSWRQVAGPRGTFTDPFSARTTFLAPEFQEGDPARDYVFELTVDATPPGDRSVPLFFLVKQQARDSTPPTTPPAGGQPVLARVFINGVAASEIATVSGTTVSFARVTISALAPDGSLLEVRVVDAQGAIQAGVAALRTLTLRFAAGGQSNLDSSASGELFIASSLLGATVSGVQTNLGSSAPPPPASGGGGAVAGGPGGGGGGCTMASAASPASTLPAFLAFLWIAVTRRRR